MKITVLVGPTCSGKTTILNKLVEEHGFGSIVSHTTRAMRTGEIHGKDYYFTSFEEFEKMRGNLEFIENITFGSNSYGVSVGELKRVSESGKRPVLIVEPTGLGQILDFVKDLPHISVVPFYLDGRLRDLMARYLHRMAGEDLSNLGVRERNAGRLASISDEIEFWHPSTQYYPNLKYAYVFTECGPHNEKEVIKTILEKING